MSQAALFSKHPSDCFQTLFWGQFWGVLHWQQLDELWQCVLADKASGWFIYMVGDSVPRQPAAEQQLEYFIQQIDQLLRDEHKEDYCGIVYTDDYQQPTMIKIFDPNHLGSVCGSGREPTLPGWVLTKVAPTDLITNTPDANGRKRWMNKKLNLTAMIIGVIVIFGSLALLQATAKEKDNAASLLAQRVLENSTEQVGIQPKQLIETKQTMQFDQSFQDSLQQLQEAATLSEQEYEALSIEERQQYQMLQTHVSNIMQQLEEAELERQRLYNAMEKMSQKNEELNREIDAMRPALLEASMEAEKEVLVSSQSQ